MIKPQPMKIQCVKCSVTMIIAPKSDAIFVPCCKKCGGEMKIVCGVEGGLDGFKKLIEKLANLGK